MAKCATCGERKGNRFYPGGNASICSLCCGTKKETEILCVEACEYLGKGKWAHLFRKLGSTG